MIRILLIAFLLMNISAIAQDTDTLCLIFSKQKNNSTSKNFVLERNDFVKVNLKDGTKTKGRISNISENGFKLDSTYVKLENLVRLGMNSKERRHIGQYLSAWILGVGVTAAAAGIVLVFSADHDDTGIDLMEIGALSGLTSTYTIDLAYGKRKKFDFKDEKWGIKAVPLNSIVYKQ